ncbi:MAG: 50S ribosomal protein L25 [Candidatus Aquicultor secundus]|uniref:Large ribosomal subunit protein bL25 n=1 Tax=Candidatus Aquicultor secundus TaxID=1973895 RepID=A0A2M7T4Q2_9ACTN|nr:50S ribosomal protein L25 [Candidatus Aquicultor secundus]NCO66600.1 50S ribosomal protein L25 [Solirubrobacter sp.]OIO88344.1 MAG: hypothetical protein AUK32_01785 [Candidatus Aquicultor secundus]PIU27603.1 MAG: 50S ribosomal protein L25 [Candidatus Aquicultor secundus]PIW23166.1 MAG: 50S ribosomal protein L25 [Candidatus Aquicultor secundus]PIX52714.1 MAG: 50S ribosomal protein L25 [Candidatus Aquicultor secundus]
MDIFELKAEKREVVGKESSKKLRRQGQIPAVLYSDGGSTPIIISAREFSTLVHSGAGTHVIFKLKLPGAKRHPNAVIKEVQRNPVRAEYLHIDFQKIALDEKIAAMVPIAIVGEAPGIKEGGVLERHTETIEIEGMPQAMPDHIEVDVSELQLGESVHAKDLGLTDGLEMLTDPEAVVVAIAVPRVVTVTTEAVEGIAPEAVEGSAEAAARAAEKE